MCMGGLCGTWMAFRSAKLGVSSRCRSRMPVTGHVRLPCTGRDCQSACSQAHLGFSQATRRKRDSRQRTWASQRSMQMRS